ncbi:hypothetical protein EN809_010500 [Mesorhizobium sp. M2E.F.Ca.ET.166.01.1.1]|nr:hypothetical protein EN862_000055 [Mesorhizobium sp. M2E.F.Ca.ET.219.01.1.1]TGT77956.1 hypothetical protein EN809_010500 [Mesorhizobium sp. M2E.F.Ca.ET.166.01.1.1]TGW04066.1 hypothetical protein EN797_010500 [Mesorhizobium sp. M2E.F.Ca.ET.154.01.1.1]
MNGITSHRASPCRTVTSRASTEICVICLNETLFANLAQARTAIQLWKEDYNQHRPHSAAGNVTPAEFASNETGKPGRVKKSTLGLSEKSEETWVSGQVHGR